MSIFSSAPIEFHSRSERLLLWLSAAIAFFLLLLDQLSKLWIAHSFRLYESRPVIAGWLSLTSVRNHGAAWSMLSGYGWLLLLIALAALAAILWFFRSLTEGWGERYIAAFLVIPSTSRRAFVSAFKTPDSEPNFSISACAISLVFLRGIKA